MSPLQLVLRCSRCGQRSHEQLDGQPSAAQFDHELPASGSASGHPAGGGMQVVDSIDHHPRPTCARYRERLHTQRAPPTVCASDSHGLGSEPNLGLRVAMLELRQPSVGLAQRPSARRTSSRPSIERTTGLRLGRHCRSIPWTTRRSARAARPSSLSEPGARPPPRSTPRGRARALGCRAARRATHP